MPEILTFEAKEVPKNLIPIQNQAGELLVDSRKVAELFEIQHATLLKTIAENEKSLDSLGGIRYQKESPSGNNGGGNPRKFVWLDFDQVALLLTLTQTTERTKEYRLQLILAFKRAREQLRPVDTLLLAIPEVWQKTFPDDFYTALLSIYGAEFDSEKNKPSWVGSWTNRFIYDPIYTGLPAELKRKRQEFVSASGRDPEWIKLHQFLEENAKEQLKVMISKVTAILQVSRSKQDFAENYAAMMGGEKQLRISDLLRDFYT